MKHLPRMVLAVLASLVLAILTAQLLARGAFVLLGVTGIRDGVTVAAIVVSLVAVPLVAGLTLGFVAQRWLFPLSLAVVVLSLAGTYASLGPSGLPSGWKIVEYGAQLVLIYIAARWGSAFARGRAHSTMRPA